MNDQQETTQKCNESKSPNRKSLLVGLFLGAVAGAVLCGAAVVTRRGFSARVAGLDAAMGALLGSCSACGEGLPIVTDAFAGG